MVTVHVEGYVCTREVSMVGQGQTNGNGNTLKESLLIDHSNVSSNFNGETNIDIDRSQHDI